MQHEAQKQKSVITKTTFNQLEMKNLKAILAALLLIVAAQSASAQFKIGPRLGINVSELHFNSSVFDSSNRAGFTGGLMAEFTVPVVGIGFDASLMYSRRNAEWMASQGVKTTATRDYFNIPVNLKWKLSLPLVKPFLTTGPDFAFLTSRSAINEAYRNHKVNTSWSFGLGAEILGHLQIGASYGIGLNKALERIGAIDGYQEIEAKNRVWTITAAYLF